MSDFIETLITKPSYAIIGVAVTWVILSFLLIKIFTLNSRWWIILEFVWIIIGLIGVLILVDENRKQFALQELEAVQLWITNDSKSLGDYAVHPMHCFQYTNSGIFSQNEFDSRQAHSDSICAWAKK